MRSYAFAARFVAQARVLLVAQSWTPGIELLLASDPWLLWAPNGVRHGEPETWRAALAAVRALPSGSVDRIIWLQDEGLAMLADGGQWMIECSRILDRNGTLMIRQPRPSKKAIGEAGEDQFWGLADRLHAEFPWVDVAAEVPWGASSVTPVEIPDQGFAPLQIDSRLADDDLAHCEAYWCLCALRKEDTENWRRPTLLLQAQGQQDPRDFWAKKEQARQHCEDAAKLMTAQRRICSLQARLDTLAAQTQAWQQEEKPELLCKMVELQDRSMWLREQVVALEQRSVQNIEAKTRLESELAQARAHCQDQDKTIRELKARLEVLLHVSPKEKATPPKDEPVVVREDSAVILLDTPVQCVPEPAVQSLALRLESVPPDDHRVLAAPAPKPRPWSVKEWTQKVQEQRSKLGAQAPEFVTRPLEPGDPDPE